ncbi:MAG: hypothetical protein ACE5JG_10775 [Planctomycetota bacterium]
MELQERQGAGTMTKSIDPFEEYLRKRKIEILEKKYRRKGKKQDPPEEEPEAEETLADEDPEVAARVREEMQDFFETGSTAAADLVQRMEGEQPAPVADDDIEEVLDEVFVETKDKPQVDKQGTFVEFFRKVQKDFDPSELKSGELPALTLEPEAPEMQPVPAGEEEAPARRGVAKKTGRREAVHEDETVEFHAEEVGAEEDIGPGTVAVDLAEVLLARTTDADLEELRQHLDLLCRLVAKLVERSRLPENEIVEVLIKSGVEF